MSEHFEQPQDEKVAAPADAGVETIVIEVGHVVRLATGEHVEVQGVRRTADGIQIMRAAGEWLDARDADVIPQD